MKFLKSVAIVLAFLAVIAVVAHTYRESIARNLVNSALREQGVTATELSIQSLRTDYVNLSQVVLEQDDGTRYEISGLSFPLSFPSMQPESISIDKLVLVPPETGTGPIPFARVLQTFLDLPTSVPNTEIAVSQLTMLGMPAVEDIVWRLEEQAQHIVFSVHSVDVTVDVETAPNGGYRITGRAISDRNTDASSLSIDIRRNTTGYALDGMLATNLQYWLPLLTSAGYLPNDIVSLNAMLNNRISLALYDDESLPPEWTIEAKLIDLSLEIESIGHVKVRVTDLNCYSGIRCTTHMLLNADRIQLGDIALGSTMLSTSLDLFLEETIRVDIARDFLLALNEVESLGWFVKSIHSTNFSGAHLIRDNAIWQGDIDRLVLVFDSITDRNSTLASLPVAFKKLHFQNTSATLAADFSIPPHAAAFSWDGTDIVVPGIEGRISRQGDTASADFELVDTSDGVDAHVDVSHDLVSGKGSLTVDDAVLRFANRRLSEYFVKWPYAFELVAGSWSTSLDIDWKITGGTTEYQSSMDHRAQDLVGSFDDYAFAGVQTNLTGNVSSTSDTGLLRSTMKVAFLDIGVGLEDLTANIELNLSTQEAKVENLAMSALGGRLLADPFRLDLREMKTEVVLRPESVQLQFMADLAEFENIELSGSLSGMIPVSVNENGITISDGRLVNDPPGGTIRYRPDRVTGDSADMDSGIGLVSRALANFQFDSLTSDVNYTENGDLMLQMKLKGVNPDMDANQPVILNLGVENNIPQLLRSLRATRSIEEILERRSGK